MQGEGRQLIREGKVSAQIPERHSVRVMFEDKDNLTSYELPVLTPCASTNKFYALPDVGETVVCLFASNSEQVGDGWVIGSRFHDKIPPNARSADITRMDFADGTFIQYDRKRHELQINCAGVVRINGEEIYLN